MTHRKTVIVARVLPPGGGYDSIETRDDALAALDKLRASSDHQLWSGDLFWSDRDNGWYVKPDIPQAGHDTP